MRRLVRFAAGWLLACGVVAVLLGSPVLAGVASAQTGERIQSFDVHVVVNDDGSADFVEIITYDFGTNERHGIDRILVTRQRYDDQNDRVYPLTVERVEATGASSQYEVSDVGGGSQRIRIGDPDRTTTGSHTYTIAYRLDGIVNKQPGPDELYWNITGSDWGVPIQQTSVRVEVPGGAEKVVCYAGASSSDSCDSATVEGGVALFIQGPTSSGEELTVAVAIPDTNGDDIEPQPILAKRPETFSFRKAFTVNPITAGGAVALTAGLGALIASLQFRAGRDRRSIGSPTDIAFAPAGAPSEPVPLFERAGTPVEFVPPDNIRPGQLGVIRDETADTVDVSATIIDLAVRGYLRIEEIPDRKGRPDDYRFVRLTKSGGLLDYETYLLQELFESGPSVELSTLKNKFAKSLSGTKDRLYADAVAQGWFEHRPDRVRQIWAFLGVVATIAGGAVLFVLARFTHVALLGVPLALAGLALLIGSRFMPRRTAKGTGVYRRVLGFEDFIENSEKHRAQWAERVGLFSEYLPYAIALGATRKWARTLEALGAPPPDTSSWYVGTRPFVWASFGDQMNHFSSSASTTLSSTPGGSGGSGFSGGSAGGGGGGGGGGSW
jgi:hypothetical protein